MADVGRYRSGDSLPHMFADLMRRVQRLERGGQGAALLPADFPGGGRALSAMGAPFVVYGPDTMCVWSMVIPAAVADYTVTADVLTDSTSWVLQAELVPFDPAGTTAAVSHSGSGAWSGSLALANGAITSGVLTLSLLIATDHAATVLTTAVVGV